MFLITPILVVMPLSFNAEDFFTFTPEMLRFDPEGYSLKHYRDFFTNPDWQARDAQLAADRAGGDAAVGQLRHPGRHRPAASRMSRSAGRSWRS